MPNLLIIEKKRIKVKFQISKLEMLRLFIWLLAFAIFSRKQGHSWFVHKDHFVRGSYTLLALLLWMGETIQYLTYPSVCSPSGNLLANTHLKIGK
jgi:hypothetical protein